MGVSAKAIAQELGLSQSTVSLALRGRAGVNENTKKKILQKAAEMGYHKLEPSQIHAPRFISLVLYKKHGSVLADTPFFSDLIQGIEHQAKACGYQLFITYFYEKQNIQEQLESLKNSFCAGIILLATEMHDRDFLPFHSLQVPLIVLDRYFPEFDYDCVVINNIYGAKRAVRHLIEKGHTRIGYLHSNVEIRNFRERYEGYLKGMRLLNRPDFEKSFIVPISPVAEEASKDMDLYLSRDPQLPTAFFADNDNIASSCMISLQKAGYRVPEDISIIGFDDMPICKMLRPALSTMSVAKAQLGACAVDFLIRRINGQTDVTYKLELKPHLIERDSVQEL